MSATVIILPRVRIDDCAPDQEVLCVRLPRRVYQRLEKIASAWNLAPAAAAEMLLTDAVNKAVGIRKRR